MIKVIKKLRDALDDIVLPKGLLITVIILVSYLSGFNTWLSFLLQKALDNVLFGGNTQQLLICSILLIASCIGYIYITYTYGVTKERLYQKIASCLKVKTLNHFLGLPYERANQVSSGDILTIITDDCDKCANFFISSLLPLLQTVCSISIGLIYAFGVSWHIGVFLIMVMPIFYVTNKLLSKKMGISFSEYQKCEGNHNSFFNEVARNIGIIQVFRLSTVILEKDNLLFNKKYAAGNKKAQSVSKMHTITETGVMLIELLILTGGILLVCNNDLNHAALIGIWNAGIGSIIYPVTELPGVISSVVEQVTSLDRIHSIMGEKSEEHIEEKDCIVGESPRLIVDKISFGYAQNAKKCIHDLSFECNKKDIICVIGESGAGKTTLLKLILGMYRPDSGSIILQDEDRIIQSTNINKYISYVPQDKQLFNMSILDNVLFGQEASFHDVVDVIKKVGLEEFVERLPHKYHSVIGDNIGLSQGQAQRLCIARALLRKTPFIVCDEPFSALDSDNAYELMQLIKILSADTGFIIVSHNEKSLSIATKTIVIDGGLNYEK